MTGKKKWKNLSSDSSGGGTPGEILKFQIALIHDQIKGEGIFEGKKPDIPTLRKLTEQLTEIESLLESLNLKGGGADD